jgi:site-specific DNA recombinase
MVKHKSETYKGEQEAIVDPSTWQRVQSLLERNGRTGGGLVRNAFGALLKGLLHCKPCDCAMTPSHSTKGNRRYRYYTCTTAQKRGWGNCPSKSVPAGELERFVVDQIRCIGRDPTVLGATLEQVRTQSHERRMDLEAEQRELTQNLARWHAEVRKEFEQPDGHAGAQGVARLAELLERIKAAETRLKTLGDEITVANLAQIDPNEAENALARFDDVWEYLSPHERCRFVQLLIKRVDFDGGRGKMSITYHDTGIQSLAGELAHWEKSA